MRVISKRTLREFWEKHPNAEPNLLQWYQRTSEAAWKNLAEVRQVFLSADSVGNFTIFNISGNNYRLITFIVRIQVKKTSVTTSGKINE